jgi:hypothetical protein
VRILLKIVLPINQATTRPLIFVLFFIIIHHIQSFIVIGTRDEGGHAVSSLPRYNHCVPVDLLRHSNCFTHLCPFLVSSPIVPQSFPSCIFTAGTLCILDKDVFLIPSGSWLYY